VPKQLLPAGASASAATSRAAGPAAGTAAAPLAGQAAAVRPVAAGPPRPSALYSSPMQHITVSVKVLYVCY
jgi:hypothetical protein